MIKNVVFDMGMVLLIYNPMLPCLRHAGNKEDAKRVFDALFCQPEWLTLDKGTATEDEVLRAAQARLETPELKALASSVMTDWHLDGLWPKEGMEQVTSALLEKGYQLYILSNAGHRFHRYEYKIPNLDRFSGVLVSAEENMLKPDHAIFERLMHKFNLKAEECVFVDDVPANVQASESIGMTGYCYADGDVAKLRAFFEQL